MIGVHSLDEVLKERNQINKDMTSVLNETVSDWGLLVEKVEIKDIEIPEASEQLAAASRMMTDNPVSLELRRMQMITEVGAEQNTTTIDMIPPIFST